MFLDVFGYILGSGFIILGICALYFMSYEMYEVFTKGEKTVSFKRTTYLALGAVFCGVILIITANII